MSAEFRRARDLALLDAVDAFKREPFSKTVWRIARGGRDPTIGSPSRSRWSHGGFDVLCTSLERDGALAEIHALLSAQPVFPTRDPWFAHQLKISADRTLKIADLPTLGKLGVDVGHYFERDYSRTQEVADAAHFLGFDGLVAPSARWSCLNAVLFTERLRPDQIEIVDSDAGAVDWAAWRKRVRDR